MIGNVIATALREALLQLTPDALGLRSHAVPTEEHLDECLKAVYGLLADAPFLGTRVIIGSSKPWTGPLENPRVMVLPPDAAAAEATRVRNDPAIVGLPRFRLVYLNSESTAGEAGLDGLSELRAPAIAKHFALNAGLPVLAELAKSKARPIVHRLEDSSVDQLALYAATAQSEKSELAALPLLGLIPRDHSKSHPSSAWATDFDALSGEKLVAKLREASQALERLEPAARAKTAASLDPRLIPPRWRVDPFGFVLAVCRATHRYANGHVDELPGLCGLSSTLLRLLRRGDLVADESPDPDPDTPTEPSPGQTTRRPQLEEELLENGGLAGLRCDLEALDPSGRFLTVSRESGESDQLRSREGAALVVLLLSRLPARFWTEGAATTVSSRDALLTPSVPAGVTLEETSGLGDWQRFAPGTLGARIADFLQTRARFLDAVSAGAPKEVDAHADDDDSEAGSTPAVGSRYTRSQGILLLEAFPLTAVAAASSEAAAYVSSYEALVSEALLSSSTLAEDLGIWLTNLDIAFHEDRGTVVAARFLPTHPLRIAHSLEWLRRGQRPPSFPPAIAVHYRRKDWLTPHGREYSFHSNTQAVGPSTDGLRAAAREGLRDLWMLLSPRSLGRAIDVELVDVTNPVEVIEAICEELLDCFQEDNSVAAVHLRVAFAFSDQSRHSEAIVPTPDDLLPLGSELLDARPGVGVSLEVSRTTRHSGSAPCHLAIQAVDTPYVRLPVDLGGGDRPGMAVTYVPGPAGNISLIKLTGHTAIDAYLRLLDQFHLPVWLGYAPIQRPAEVGRAIVRSLVSREGWPTRLPLDDTFLSYSQDGSHVVVTLCDRDVLASLLPAHLAALSDRLEGAAVPDLQSLRDGVRAMYACRAFLSNVLAGSDPRHLLGDLGLLRAFAAAQSKAGAGHVLAISLDGPDGRAWAAQLGQLTKSSETRADLLILEADADLRTLVSVRVAELKARTTTAELGPASLNKLARQAQITSARLRACWSDTNAEDRRTRIEALRRLAWMGAGHQLQALRWKAVLQDLDRSLSSGPAPEVKSECWIVPEDDCRSETFTRALPALDEAGRSADGEEPVRFQILGRQALKAPNAAERPLSPSAQRSRPPVPVDREVSADAQPELPTPPVSTSKTSAGVGAVDSGSAQRPSGASEKLEPAAGDPRAASASVRLAPALDSELFSIPLGIDRHSGAPATWRPYERSPRLSNQHLLVVGKSGSGKSETTKALVWELQNRGVPTIIFDFQGEYGDPTKDFYRAVAPQVFDAMLGLPVNPFEIPLDPRTGLQRPFIESVFRLADTLNRVFRGSGDIQLGLLRDAIRSCYTSQGFLQDDPGTWANKPPTVDMLHDELERMVPHRGAQVKNLLVRLQPLFESGIFRPGRAGFCMEDLFRRTTVLLMTSGISDLMLAASRLMLEGIYSSMLAAGESPTIRAMACVDEAHKLCGDETITTLIKEARKYGLGLILSSQETRDFHPSVFANVGTLICLQLEEADAGIMAKQIAAQDLQGQRGLKQMIMSLTFPQGIVRSNHFQPYSALRLTPFHERLASQAHDGAQGSRPSGSEPLAAEHPVASATPRPETFLSYELVRPLKGGGMAEVYEARERDTGELVCIKRVRAASASIDADALQREAQIYQKLQHIECPNLLRVRSFERDGAYWALVTDYAAGGDLATYVRQEDGGRLKPAQVKQVALQLANGVKALHAANIVHRDLKPENALLNGEHWQLADFGIAKNLTRLVTMRTFQASGTLGYMAPEQLDGSEAHPSADIYSLAKVMVFMLTGGTDKDYVTQLGWRSLVFACLDPAPANRPSIERVTEDLERIHA